MAKLLISFLMRLVLMIIAVVILMTGGCRHVNQQRAVEYYDQHVQHFPEEG